MISNVYKFVIAALVVGIVACSTKNAEATNRRLFQRVQVQRVVVRQPVQRVQRVVVRQRVQRVQQVVVQPVVQYQVQQLQRIEAIAVQPVYTTQQVVQRSVQRVVQPVQRVVNHSCNALFVK